MHVPTAILVVLILFALPTVICLFCWGQDLGRPHGLTFLGPIERWSGNSSADRTWCIFYVPIFRSRWSHSTALHD